MKEYIIRIIYILLLAGIFGVGQVQAQSDAIKNMRNQAAALRSEIEQKKKILLSAEQDVNAQLRNLRIVESQIKDQKALVALLKNEVRALDKDIRQTNADIKRQEERVDRSRAEYAEALRRSRKYSKANNKLHFLMESEDFRTLIRRYRYTNEYMDAHTRLAESLEGQIAILEEKKAELETVLAMKNESLKEQEAVSADLARLGKEQSSILDKLKKQSSKVKAEINKKQQELNKLNKRIDAEIERVLAEERAAKKRAEEAAKKKNAASGSRSGSKNSSNKASVFADDAGVAEMTGSFLKNKKKMPVPITGPYLVVDEYGTKNVIEGKGNVQIDNKGVVLEGSKGAQARCIFEGRVTAVVNDGNYHFVLIRHGEYISVYCNIVNMRVSGGEKVKAGEVIGDIGIDVKSGTPRMQFQLRKEKQTLNPAEWIRM